MAVDILNKSLEGTINLLFAITCLKMGLPVRNSCSASECGQQILTTKVANDRWKEPNCIRTNETRSNWQTFEWNRDGEKHSKEIWWTLLFKHASSSIFRFEEIFFYFRMHDCNLNNTLNFFLFGTSIFWLMLLLRLCGIFSLGFWRLNYLFGFLRVLFLRCWYIKRALFLLVLVGWEMLARQNWHGMYRVRERQKHVMRFEWK